jgi:hypothetical protein
LTIREVNEWNPELTEIGETMNLMLKGRSNNCGSFTMTADSTTTTVSDNLFKADQCVYLMPTSANAAAESPYLSSRSEGSFILTHGSTSATDKTFLYIRIG